MKHPNVRGANETKSQAVHNESGICLYQSGDLQETTGLLQSARHLYRGIRRRLMRSLPGKAHTVRSHLNPMMKHNPVAKLLIEELAVICHSHLSLLARELIPKVSDNALRIHLAQTYGTPYACLEDKDRIRARNLAYDIVRTIDILGEP